MASWLAAFLFALSVDTSAGDRLYADGQFEQAAGVYRDLLRRSPRDLNLLIRLGATQYQLGTFGAAEKFFRTAVSLAPRSTQAEVGLGTSLLALGRSKEAVPVLERTAKLAPADRMVQRSLGHAYQKENDLFNGERVLKALVETDPQDAESWSYLGTLFYDTNYYTRALEAFDHVLQLRPDDVLAQIYKAGSLAQLGRTDEAGSSYRNLESREGPAARPEFWLGYAQFLFEEQQLKPSLEAINRASAVLPDSAKLLFWRARILMNMGETEQAESDAKRAVALSPDLPNAHNLLMKIYRLRGFNNEADKEGRWLAGHTTSGKANSQ